MTDSLESRKRWNAPRPGAFRHFVPYVLLVAISFAAFARSLWAAPLWDDEFITTRNPHLASWSGLKLLVSTDIWSSSALEEKSGYYRPVASLSYALNRFVFGNSAASYHAGNVILHAITVALLFRFITLRKIATGLRAFAVVALFATMPLVAEPVSWIAGRYDLLGTFFAVLALVANEGRMRAWATPLFFLAAASSKEPFVLALGLVVLDDLILWRRQARAELIKWGGLVACVVASFVLRHVASVPPASRLLDQGGVTEVVRAYAFAWSTLGALAVHPSNLCFFHTYATPSIAETCAVLALLIAALGAAAWWWRRAPSNASHAAPAFGLVWCLAAMLPGALTGPTLRIIGDRYAYFPLVGAAIALAGLIEMVPRTNVLRWSPALLLGLAFAQTFRLESRLGELQSEDAMFTATLARDPDNFTTLTMYGTLLAQRGEYARAEDMLQHARKVAPVTGDVDAALSFVHLHEKRYAEAEEDAQRAVAAKPQNPRAWLNLASALVDQGKAAPAVDAATHALDVRPHYAEAHYVRAIAYLKLGQTDAAHDDLVETLAIDASHAKARALLQRFQPQVTAPR